MALNEITKGMSNAAEQINENFSMGSIVDSGSNENGRYDKFGNGLMICSGTLLFDLKGSEVWQTLPQSYIDTAFTVSLSGEGSGYETLENLAIIGAGASGFDGIRLKRYNDIPFRGTSTISINWMTIGRWK